MLAAEAFSLTEEIARDLRARGQDEHAGALERVLSVATAALGDHDPRPQAAYLSLGQAARALGGSTRLVRELIARGELEGERLGSALLVSRDALRDYFERVSARAIQWERSHDAPARAKVHNKVVAALPSDAVARQAVLLERQAEGSRLSKSERNELAQLERTLAAAATQKVADLFGLANEGPS